MIPSPGYPGRVGAGGEILGSRYHVTRAMATGLVFVAMSASGLLADWSTGFYVAGVSAAVGAHALWSIKRPGPVFHSLLVDTTGVIIVLGLLAPPAGVGIAPVLAISTTAVLYLDYRKALVVAGYAVVGVAAALTWDHLAGRVEWTVTQTVGLVAISIFALHPLMWWLLKKASIAVTERRTLEETLHEKESRYRLIAENVSDAILLADETGAIVYCNPAVERIFGYAPDDLVGSDLRVLMPERFREKHRSTVRSYLETGRPSSDWLGMHQTGLHRDGHELALEVSYGEFLGKEGRRFIGTIRDVTDRHAAEAALRESEARYRGLFEGVPVGVYRTSLTGEILDANPKLIELLGYSEPSEVLGRPAQSFYVDPSDRDVWRHEIEAEEALAGHEIQLKRPDGTMIWLRDSGRELRDEAGEIVGYEGTLEDITVRRKAEERLQAMVETQRHRLLYEKALSTCSHALLVGTDDRALEAALEALLEATGVGSVFIERNSQHPELGPVTSLIYEINSDRRLPEYERWQDLPWSDLPVAYSHLSRNEPYAFGVHELQGEEKRVYEETATKSELDIPIFVGSEWVGLIGFADFEQERPWRSEEISLLRTAAQMIGSFWERQQAHQQLQELVKYKDEFVASVSHELRTPLTAVVGLSEELVNVSPHTFTPEELAEFHQLIAQQSREVAYIVEDLLVAARVEIDTVSIDSQPVDHDAEVTATNRGWPSEFESIERRLGDVKVNADPTRVRQIIRNLLTNAIRYGGTHVVVSSRAEGGTGFLQVRDDGPGIDVEHIERIFRPYERVASADVARPGSVGLGLYVSRQLANLMGGDLSCRREPGETVFELSLPLL